MVSSNQLKGVDNLATTKNITMKQFNGTDYDTLYPKTIASQVDGVYNKTEILTAATAALYGLPDTAVPDNAFAAIVSKAKLYRELRRFETPGSFTFVVPNGIGHILAFVIGAGGSGIASVRSSMTAFPGGASGHLKMFVSDVTAGQEILGVVGKGGASVSSKNTDVNGNNGGTSSFGSVTANGGTGASSSTSSEGLTPSIESGETTPTADTQIISKSAISFGEAMALILMNTIYAKDNLPSNFAAGGAVTIRDGTQESVLFDNGKKSSASKYATSGNLTAESGTDVGCGGGTAFIYTTSTSYTARSAPGMDGAVVVLGY